MRGRRILLAHADGAVAASLQTAIRRRDYRVATAASPRQALLLCRRHAPIDVAIVDLALPGMVGAELIARLRAMGVAVLVALSDRDDLAGRAAARASGADDYVAKPVSIDELLARAGVALDQARARTSELQAGRVRVDVARQSIVVAGVAVSATRKEVELLAELARAGGAVVSRRRLLAAVWETDWQGGSQTIAVHVSGLRRKLGAHARIQAVRGVGYRLVVGS